RPGREDARLDAQVAGPGTRRFRAQADRSIPSHGQPATHDHRQDEPGGTNRRHDCNPPSILPTTRPGTHHTSPPAAPTSGAAATGGALPIRPTTRKLVGGEYRRRSRPSPASSLGEFLPPRPWGPFPCPESRSMISTTPAWRSTAP